MKNYVIYTILFLMLYACKAESNQTDKVEENNTGDIQKDTIAKPAALQISSYLPLIEGKNVGLVVNQTSTLNGVHLVDSLISLNVNITKIFAPEHGFRGKASAGEKIEHGTDAKTGLPILSLYGKNRKPTPEMLSDLDVVIFDIQDVGVRFYTYISTMHYMMEACAENNIPLIVLDRPNPNGDYVDGPVLDTNFISFVGMHPIPVVHGCTVGELAKMINGEGWLENGVKCDLTIIEMENYTHNMRYSLPVRPSPNLPNDLSIRLYPSLCFFEGTQISVGRGTDFPFQVAGYPDERFGNFTFTPVSMPEAAKYPKYENEKCYGIDLRNKKLSHKFTLKYLIYFYQKFENKEEFFLESLFIDRLAGTSELRKQIIKGLTEDEIRATWQEKLDNYNLIRQKYLIYE